MHANKPSDARFFPARFQGTFTVCGHKHTQGFPGHICGKEPILSVVGRVLVFTAKQSNPYHFTRPRLGGVLAWTRYPIDGRYQMPLDFDENVKLLIMSGGAQTA